jgi:hypothetical protein
MDESSTPSEISNQLDGLRLQNFIGLLALVIISGALTFFLGMQSRFTERDINAIRSQATQVFETYKRNQPMIQNFVQQLAAYGQTHPDFQQQVLRKYGITPQTVAGMKK